MIDFIGKRRIFFGISAILVALSLISILVWGIPLGIDFKGGILLEIEYSHSSPDVLAVSSAINQGGLGNPFVQTTRERGFLIRMQIPEMEEGKDLEDKHQAILAALKNTESENNTFKENRFESIGPVVGRELKQKAVMAIITALTAILLYIAWAFRKVSYRISSWKYGMIALVALMHDIIIPTGIFAALGHFKGIQIDSLFITALLTILGFSIHDTIVVFDRVRENLKRYQKEAFSDIVNKSINETISRSVNTSLTTLIVLLSVFFFGGASVHYFSLVLVIGIFFGTYSSLFLASPLLVAWESWRER